jgi:hypothetical protein
MHHFESLSIAQLARTRLAAAVRRGESPEAIARIREELAEANQEMSRRKTEARIGNFIRQELAKSPPLTADQRERLGLLLLGPSG